MIDWRIPIQNIYYLLCYAWNQLEQGGLIDVTRVPTTRLEDLFAKVLCDGIQHLARRGLEQGYQLREEELAGVRGRISVLESARRFMPQHGRAVCHFDELTVNTLANRILKGTLGRLAAIDTLHPESRKRVRLLLRDLHDIDDDEVTALSFRQVQLHSNNRFYRFLLNVCELIHGAWLIDSATGKTRFRDFLRDERRMARVFQDFHRIGEQDAPPHLLQPRTLKLLDDIREAAEFICDSAHGKSPTSASRHRIGHGVHHDERDIQHREEVAAICCRAGARRLDVFGSAVREDFDPATSDLDFLVEFDDLSPRKHSVSGNFRLGRIGRQPARPAIDRAMRIAQSDRNYSDPPGRSLLAYRMLETSLS